MSTRQGNAEIYVMNANGTGLTRLTSNHAIDAEPAWNANGKIAFSSTRDGNFEIYSMNANGTGVTRLTNSSGWNVSPPPPPPGPPQGPRTFVGSLPSGVDGEFQANLFTKYISISPYVLAQIFPRNSQSEKSLTRS